LIAGLSAQAAAAFEDAAAADPGSLKALGNWGNALLEHGRVRAKNAVFDVVSVLNT